MKTNEESSSKKTKDEILNWVASEYYKALESTSEWAEEKRFRARQSFENELNRYSHFIDLFGQKLSFVEGVFLGLFFGIVGNILVSHYYGMIESWSLSSFDALFEINRLVFLVSLVLILVVSFYYYRKFKEWKKAEQSWVERLKKIYEEYVAKLHDIMEEDFERSRRERVRVLEEAKRKFGAESKEKEQQKL